MAMPLALHGEPVKSNHVEAELVCEMKAIQPGEPFWVGVWLKPDPGWHTYWINPGDSGMGALVEWLVPDGFTVGPLAWPCPERITEGELASYGYTSEVLLMAKVTPSREVAGTRNLGCRARWLACKEVCLPGQVDLNRPVTAAAKPESDPALAALFARTRSRLPVEPSGWRFHATFTDERYILTVIPDAPVGHPVEDVYFFPFDPALIMHDKPQLWSRAEGYQRLLIPRSIYNKELAKELAGVLYAGEGWDPEGRLTAFSIKVPVEKIYK
jgi:thiol:disulfide interchange protein DsbD